MNLIEAIKSGKRFKRRTEITYRDSQQYYYKSDPAFYLLRIEDTLADDWEVEREPVLITREQFDAAWRRAEDVCENMEIKTFHYLYELVVRELGL